MCGTVAGRVAALRSFVADTLSAAARDILAAVDRLVAELEEEEAGLRRPEARGLELRSADSKSPDQDEDLITPSRSRPDPLRKTQRPGRPRNSRTRNHIALKIRILDRPETCLLSQDVLRCCPLQELRCSPGLQEADFTALLRSSFPLLDRPFDLLTADRRRRLTPLRLGSLTPEEVLQRTGGTLHIRLKAQEEPQNQEPQNQEPQKQEPRKQEPRKQEPRKQEPRKQEPRNQETRGGSDTSAQQETRKQASFSLREVEGSNAHIIDDDADEEEDDDEAQWSGEQREAGEPHSATFSLRQTVVEDGQVSCKVCGAPQRSEVELVKHARDHEDQSERICGACGERSASAALLKDPLRKRHPTRDGHECGAPLLSVLAPDEHAAAHSGETPEDQLQRAAGRHKCHTCMKEFHLKEALTLHRKTHTSGKSHLCGVCGKSLCDSRSLSRHMMVHSEERPHACAVCGKRFKLAGTLRQHQKIHTPRQRSFLCHVCSRMFLTAQQLLNHMHTHADRKLHRCHLCSKSFAKKAALTVHARVHTGEAPYRCTHCGLSFRWRRNLAEHLKVHTGAKPYVCPVCGKACARKVYLTVHMRTHSGERPYRCTVCDKVFTQSHCLKTHMRSHQGAPSGT